MADVYARTGRRVAAQCIPRLIQQQKVDFCIVNGENAAGGFGITENIARKMHSYGADVITSGNHVWDRKDFVGYLEKSEYMLRPFNYPPTVAGRGSTIAPSRDGTPVAVLNLQGRTNLPSIDCPFRLGRAEAKRLKEEAPVVFVDFHAEATAEKIAMGWHLDGTVTAVVGTHTHVQTADERILPNGTAYITDVGMTGPHDSIIGVDVRPVLKRFLDGLPARFEPATGPARLNAVLITANSKNGRSTKIERVNLSTDDITSLTTQP